MTTGDIERIVKLHQSVTDKDIQKALLQLLVIEVQKRGLINAPVIQPIKDTYAPPYTVTCGGAA